MNYLLCICVTAGHCLPFILFRAKIISRKLKQTRDIYCDLRSSLRRAVSKRTFYVSKRTFAVSERIVFPHDMSCLGDEIDMFSRLKRDVWLLYAIFTV